MSNTADIQAYYVANINYGQQMGPIPETNVVDFILQAESKIAQVKFQWVRINQPPPGSCFLIIIPPNTGELPDDGYLWQDADNLRRVPVNNKYILEVVSRDQGFKPNEAQTSMAKRRYRIVSGGKSQQLQFIHYLPTEVKVPARPQQSQQPQQQQQQQKQQQYIQRQSMLHPQYQQAPASQSQPKIKRTSSSTTGGTDLSENFRFVGDDLDLLTTREIASIRYKRNHHFLAELFSPATTSDIIRESKPIFGGLSSSNGSTAGGKDLKEVAEGQKKRLVELAEECANMEAEHQLRVKQIRDESKRVYSALASVPELKTKEDVKSAVDEFAVQVGGKVLPAASIIRLYTSRDPNNAEDMNTMDDNASPIALDLAVDDLLMA